MEAKMDGMEAKIDAKIDGMDAKIDGMDDKMDELKKLLQERVTNGEKVVKETHDENKRNVNHDSIDPNVGSKTHRVPKIEHKGKRYSIGA